MTPVRRPTTVDPVSAAGSRVTRAAVLGVVLFTLFAVPSCARRDDSGPAPVTTGSPAPQLPHPLPTAPAPNVATVGDIPSISQVVNDAIAAPRLPGAVVQIGPHAPQSRVEPIYETMQGWEGTTFRVKRWEDLPVNAQAYLNRLEQLCEVPIAIVSTGPERDETILKQHPFK